MGLANIRESSLMLWADSNLSGRYKVLAAIQQKWEVEFFSVLPLCPEAFLVMRVRPGLEQRFRS